MFVDSIGLILIQAGKTLADFLGMLKETFQALFRPPFRVGLIIQHIEFIANRSVGIIVFCVSFAAMVTIMESSYHMKLVLQEDSLVPGFAALLILRELGSVLAALLLTSKIGAGITAEIGTMTVTEQIDALKMLSINPVQYLVVPRLIACILSGLALAVISNLVCLISAMGISVANLGMSTGSFLLAMNRFVIFQDLVFAIIKGGVFGAVIPLIACYWGFRCTAGAQGVGQATTRSVVTASVAIIVLDFVMSWIFAHFY